MAVDKQEFMVGTRLSGRYKKVTYTVEVVETGEGIRYRLQDGREFKSLSAAGMAITGGAINGWRFWSLDSEGAAQAGQEQPREEIAAAVQRAERDVTFLFKLFMAVNARVLVARRTDALGYLWLLERLRRLWSAAPRQLRKEAVAWREHALPLGVSEVYPVSASPPPTGRAGSAP